MSIITRPYCSHCLIRHRQSALYETSGLWTFRVSTRLHSYSHPYRTHLSPSTAQRASFRVRQAQHEAGRHWPGRVASLCRTAKMPTSCELCAVYTSAQTRPRLAPHCLPALTDSTCESSHDQCIDLSFANAVFDLTQGNLAWPELRPSHASRPVGGACSGPYIVALSVAQRLAFFQSSTRHRFCRRLE